MMFEIISARNREVVPELSISILSEMCDGYSIESIVRLDVD